MQFTCVLRTILGPLSYIRLPFDGQLGTPSDGWCFDKHLASLGSTHFLLGTKQVKFHFKNGYLQTVAWLHSKTLVAATESILLGTAKSSIWHPSLLQTLGHKCLAGSWEPRGRAVWQYPILAPLLALSTTQRQPFMSPLRLE